MRNPGIDKVVAMGIAAAIMLGNATAQAAQTAAGCAAAKQKAAGKCASQKLKCYAAAFKSGDPVDADCLTGAALDLEIGFDRIEAKGGCSVSDDSAAVLAEIDATVDQIVADQTCSDKLKGAAKEAGSLLKCYSKATKKETGVDAGCLDAAEAKLMETWAKLEDKGKCPVSGEDGSATSALLGDLASSLGSTCSGTVFADGCWFLGEAGASCTATCAAQGKAYDSLTDIAAADAPDGFGTCANLLNALGAPAGAVQGGGNVALVACTYDPTYGRVIEFGGDPNGTFPTARRACACQ